MFELAASLTILNFLMLMSMKREIKRQTLIQREHILDKRVKSERQYFKAVEENFEEQRKNSHEFNNRMTHIMGLLQEHRYEELEDFCSAIQGSNDSHLQVVNTNNAIINVILNSKICQAMQRDIPCSVHIGDLSDCILRHKDVVLILSNLFNNAIEASEKCDDKFIYFDMMQSEEYLKIKMINNFKEKPKRERRGGTTSKNDKLLHGYGLGNILDTITRYGGESFIKVRKNQFQHLILIPLS